MTDDGKRSLLEVIVSVSLIISQVSLPSFQLFYVHVPNFYTMSQTKGLLGRH